MNNVAPDNAALERALASFEEVETSYRRALEDKGLVFAPMHEGFERACELVGELHDAGALVRNAGASISWGWLSKACVECTGSNGSETFSTTLRCHRDCYFCFNHNLPGYDEYARGGCPWREELEAAARATDGQMAVVGLTGGEPLLSLDASVEFLMRAKELFPHAHLRMYTSGDLLTSQGAERLAAAGLDEIRFSVKLDDPPQLRQTVLDNMRLACRHIDDVVVEMPIVPGSGHTMRQLMRSFDDIGIRGMNLLEFCFPFHGWNEYAKRGFRLKNPPFEVMFDYGYSGGLAVAGSQQLALELMLWGIEQQLGFGMHYCSLENKHRSEMRQRNEPGRGANPIIEFDEGDFFLKTACVFGADRQKARQVLDQLGCVQRMEDDEEESLAFAPRWARFVADAGATVMLKFYVVQRDDKGTYLSEVALKPFAR